MKRYIFLFTVLIFSISFFAQEASVEKSMNQIQIGVLGTWISNETRLCNTITLKSEIGFDGGIEYSSFGGVSNGPLYFAAAVFSVSPRWYYNLQSRAKKSKSVAGNSANFLSLETSYHPDWFIISNQSGSGIYNQVSIIPTWGLRRIGNHFNYEVGAGIGYRHIFTPAFSFDVNEAAFNLILRVGYRF
jgi:hypothetical protein